MAPLPIGIFHILPVENGCFSGSRPPLAPTTLAKNLSVVGMGSVETFAGLMLPISEDAEAPVASIAVRLASFSIMADSASGA